MRLSGLAKRCQRIQIAEKLRAAAAFKNQSRTGPCRMTPVLWSAPGVYAAGQLALPRRSFFCADPPGWTYAGFNCAWRVMIVEETGCAGIASVRPRDQTAMEAALAGLFDAPTGNDDGVGPGFDSRLCPAVDGGFESAGTPANSNLRRCVRDAQWPFQSAAH